jgi:predicted secreted protein
MFYGGFTTIVIMSMFYLAVFWTTLFQCSPREKICNPSREGKCIGGVGLIVWTAIFNIVSDVVLLVLPVRSIVRMQLSANNKVGIILLFATGLL